MVRLGSSPAELRKSRALRRPTAPGGRAPAAAPLRLPDPESPLPGAPAERDRLILATLRVRVHAGVWTGDFTRRYPRLELEVLNRDEAGPRISVGDHWISGGPPGAYTREIESFPDVLSADCLAEVANGCLYRVTFRDPPVIALYRRLGLPLPLPVRIQGGIIRWEVAARAPEFREVLRFARSVDPTFRVVSIRKGPLRDHLPALSVAQHQLLERAMAEGYFAVPRGCSLTELARRLGRSKSTVSESLAIIEKRVIESALSSMALLSAP